MTQGYSQLKVDEAGPVVWARFYNPPEHLFTLEMTIQAENLIRRCERDGRTGVIVFSGSEPGWFVEHYDASRILEAASRFADLGLGSPPVGPVMAMARGLGLFIDLFPAAGDALSLKMSKGLFSGLSQLVRFTRLLERMERSPLILIAAISGNCMGGACEFALACDFRYCIDGEEIMIGHPESLVAMPPAGGGCQRLSRAVGVGRAAAMILDGRPVPAPEALDIGLVHQLIPAAGFEEAVTAHALRLSSRSPLANRTIKDLLYRGTRLPYRKAFTREKEAVLRTSATKDAVDGLTIYTKGALSDREAEEQRRIDLYEGRLIKFAGS
ncbi:MAG: enoyl-CoA hydratase/isomerase family protein [Actinomycetota bacterium]